MNVSLDNLGNNTNNLKRLTRNKEMITNKFSLSISSLNNYSRNHFKSRWKQDCQIYVKNHQGIRKQKTCFLEQCGQFSESLSWSNWRTPSCTSNCYQSSGITIWTIHAIGRTDDWNSFYRSSVWYLFGLHFEFYDWNPI